MKVSPGVTKIKSFIKPIVDLAILVLVTTVFEDLSRNGSRQKSKSPPINIFPEHSDNS